jgi:hypothetical protein
MANGDDFDPFPPGTMTAFGGLSPDDPLADWASNVKPSDLQQFVHDPQGAIDNMVNKGQPPPDHHYQADERGNLSPMLGFAPGDPGPPRPEDTAGKVSDKRPIPPTRVTEPVRDPSQGNLTDTLGPSQGPLAPVVPYIKKGAETLQDIWRRGFGTGPGADLEPGVKPTVVPPLPPPTEVGGGPKVGPIQDRRPTDVSAKAKEDEGTKALSGKAFEDFSKSLAGVKVPPRAPLPGVGTPGVRSPSAINPSLAALLTSVGAHAPGTAVPTGLIRLLKGY